VPLAAGAMIAGEGLFMAVSCADGFLSHPNLPQRRSYIGTPQGARYTLPGASGLAVLLA
jgi:hypothetical protein